MNIRFSLTWEFVHGSSGRRFSDTVEGNLAWISKTTGEPEWTPHMSRIGRGLATYHTPSTDLRKLVADQLLQSGHMKPLIAEFNNRKTDEAALLPEQPDESLELDFNV